MTDIQTLVIVGGLIINAVAVGWNIIETFRLHKQAKNLQVSNANLQNEVNRLSVHLNQEIIRLNRILELTREMYLSATGFGHKHAMAKGIRDGKDRPISTEEYVGRIVSVDGSLVELRAIVNAVGDTDLQNLTEKLARSVPHFDVEKKPDCWFKSVIDFGNLTTKVQEQVYRLLQEATDTP